jgi:predicted nucleotidyltransferase
MPLATPAAPRDREPIAAVSEAQRPSFRETICPIFWKPEWISMAQIEVSLEIIERFCRKNRIRKLSLFGSVLRDDFRPESDIDVLVEFEENGIPGLLGISRMERELSQVFGGRKVDGLVKSPSTMSFRAQREIFREQRIENRRFLPLVEMTDSPISTFYEVIKVDLRTPEDLSKYFREEVLSSAEVKYAA